MTDRPWYASPVFYLLFAVATAVLLYLHEPIRSAFQGWADDYFSAHGISDTMRSLRPGPADGLFGLLVKAIIVVVLAVILVTFALIVWALLLGWKYYVLVPVVGAGLAVAIRSLIPPSPAGIASADARPLDPPAEDELRGNAPMPAGLPETRGTTTEARRAVIEAWLGGRDP